MHMLLDKINHMGRRLDRCATRGKASQGGADRSILLRLWKWTAWAVGAADAIAGADARPVARLRGLLSNRSSFPNRLDFACAGRLQQGEALASGCLRIPVALSFVLDLQAGPFIRIDGLEVGSFELA